AVDEHAALVHLGLPDAAQPLPIRAVGLSHAFPVRDAHDLIHGGASFPRKFSFILAALNGFVNSPTVLLRRRPGGAIMAQKECLRMERRPAYVSLAAGKALARLALVWAAASVAASGVVTVCSAGPVSIHWGSGGVPNGFAEPW